MNRHLIVHEMSAYSTVVGTLLDALKQCGRIMLQPLFNVNNRISAVEEHYFDDE